MIGYRRFRRWTLGAFGAVLVLLLVDGFFNYSVDSLGIFHPEKGLRFYPVEKLFQDKLVAGRLELADERNFQKLVVSSLPYIPDVIVIGSSRSMLLRAPYIHTKGTFFNHSVAAASLEDYVALVGLYSARGQLPKKVIISIDPWVFNKKNGLSRWKDLGEPLKAMLQKMGGVHEDVGLDRETRTNLTQLVSFEYTWRNIESLFQKKEQRFVVTGSRDVDNFVRAPDGSLYLPYAARFRKDSETEKLVAAWPESRQDYLKDFTVLSKTRLFEDLLRYLNNQQVEVVLLMIPFHPQVYEKIQTMYPMVLETEKYTRQLAAREGYEVRGSFDPQGLKLKTRDFFDGTHPHDWVLKEIFLTQ